jgi:hypothetical protein
LQSIINIILTIRKYDILKRIIVFFIPFVWFSFNCFAYSNVDSTISDHYQTRKFDVVIFSAYSHDLFPGPERFTPTKQEIENAELALLKQLAVLNSDRQNQYATPVIDKNLSKYKRQYFGYIDNNGNKILFINCFWRRDKDSDLNWLKERIRVLDGGSYFWNVKYNISKDELFDLEVNGET